MSRREEVSRLEENKAANTGGREEDGPGNQSAIALEYEKGDVAPKVIASGKGYLAEKIIDKAREYDIPVHRDEKLAGSLEQLEIGEYIPKELYQVVAEVLVYVDTMDKIKGKVMDAPDTSGRSRR